MPWNATDALDDAREATQSLLWPIETGRWLRLALIVLFVGGVGGGVPSGGGNANFGGPGETPTGPTDGAFIPPDVAAPDALVAVAIAVLALVVLVVLALMVIGPVMEFVLVEGLRTENVRVRSPFRRYLGAGLQLFLLRLGMVLVLAAVLAIPIGAVVLAGIGLSPAFLAFLLPLGLLFLCLVFVFAVAMRLTTDFVVPAMIADNAGVIEGWRRVFPLIRREWREFGIYLVLRFVLGIATSIAVGLAAGILALLVAIPFVIAGGAIFFALTSGPSALGTAGLVAIAALAVVWVLCAIAVSLFVQVPVVTYFRYYALFFLGSEDSELDLVAAFRDLDVTTE